jgi:hypothetical protein
MEQHRCCLPRGRAGEKRAGGAEAWRREGEAVVTAVPRHSTRRGGVFLAVRGVQGWPKETQSKKRGRRRR